MRVLRLLLLASIAYVLAMLWFFPAAPLVERLRPSLPATIALENVSGRIVNGTVGRARYTDALLPLEFQDVNWRLQPQAILSGAAAQLRFAGYGGEGSGNVMRRWNGDVEVSDFAMTADARRLEPLLPAPIASFSGDLSVAIDRLLLRQQLLQQFAGNVVWNAAMLERPFPANFGRVEVNIVPVDENSHRADLSADGGT